MFGRLEFVICFGFIISDLVLNYLCFKFYLRIIILGISSIFINLSADS